MLTWRRFSSAVRSLLTSAGAHGEAHTFVDAVEDDVEALHDCGSEHQAAGGGRDAESVAAQRAVHVRDRLDVKLWTYRSVCYEKDQNHQLQNVLYVSDTPRRRTEGQISRQS